MNYKLLFKIKNMPSLFSVISSSTEELMPFDLGDEQLEYSPDTLLEDKQCFTLENFNQKEFCSDFLKTEWATAHYNKWDNSQRGIEYILNTDGKNFYFQRFFNSQILKKNWFSLSGEPELKGEEIITINPIAHAYYNKNENILFFNKLDGLEKIFPGIEELSREARQNEIDDFLSNGLFDIKDYEKKKMGVSNKKRIARFTDELNNIGDQDKGKFCSELKNYCQSIEIPDNTIVIKTEDDLKNVLWHLGERFYTTYSSGEKRIANSIIKITQ